MVNYKYNLKLYSHKMVSTKTKSQRETKTKYEKAKHEKVKAKHEGSRESKFDGKDSVKFAIKRIG